MERGTSGEVLTRDGGSAGAGGSGSSSAADEPEASSKAGQGSDDSEDVVPGDPSSARASCAREPPSPSSASDLAVLTSTGAPSSSSSYASRPPPVSSYYSSDDPHHSLMEASYVKATSSPLLSPHPSRPLRKCILGICAMDKKTRSKPMTQILDRLRAYGEFVIVMFGDALLLDESIGVEEWPVCDCLISFSSKGFPLPKVIDYVKLRKPFCVNDVPSQTALLDRRQVYQILEKHKIPTPRHLYIDRTQPSSSSSDPNASLEEHPDYILIHGQRINKPLVEKPFDADDHNIYIYYSSQQGGGSRRLFRKVGNRSSRFYPKVNSLRRTGSFIYEELFTQGKDLKVYTIGPGYAHGEMRKSPVVDGIVERDPDKKELRLLTRLSEEEKQIAAQICVSFKQNICGFDIIRFQGRSYVIDVNGWSFVKGNMRYYDKCWGAGTMLLMYDGRVKPVQHIQPGDLLMGDDSTPRVVRAGSLIRGNTARDAAAWIPPQHKKKTHRAPGMYLITSSNRGRQSWTCNGDHVLVLQINVKPRVTTSNGQPAVEWLTVDGDGRLARPLPSFDSLEEAEAFAAEKRESWEPIQFECTVNEFLDLPPHLQESLHMFHPPVVRFPPPAQTLAARLESIVGRAVRREVVLKTAWVLGAWLCDGRADRPSISQIGRNHNKPKHAHTAVILTLERWYEDVHGVAVDTGVAAEMDATVAAELVVDENAQRITHPHQVTSAGNQSYEVRCGEVLRRLLVSYGLLGNKHFPLELLRESPAVRSALLTGIIDGDGHLQEERRYHVSSKQLPFIEGLVFLCRSLGLSTSSICSTQCTTNEDTDEVYDGFRVAVSGAELRDFIVPVLTYQRCPCDQEAGSQHKGDPRCANFTIISTSHGSYYGFKVDGANERLLMADFVVSHNCARILRKMSLGCRQGRQALSLGDHVELPKHLDLSIRTKDDDEKKEDEEVKKDRGIVELVTKSFVDMFSQPEDGEHDSSPDPSVSSSPLLQSPRRSVSKSANSSPVAIPALSSAALKNLSPRSLLACITAPQYADPLSPLSLEPDAAAGAATAVPSSNISVAQNVIMDTDNNDVLRALVSVFRHADRTPKQKVKLKTKHPALLQLFRPSPKKSSSSPQSSPSSSPAAPKFSELKLKKKDELAHLLHIVKVMIVKEKVRNKKRARMDKEKAAPPAPAEPQQRREERKEDSEDDEELSDDGASSAADDGDDMEKAFEREMMEKERKEREKDPDYLSKLLQVKTVLERGYVGVKVQVKPKKVEGGRVVQVLLVCKWGGEMTHAGFGQARQYAAAFWDDCCPPPPIPASFFLQSKEQREPKEEDKRTHDHASHSQSVPPSPAAAALPSRPAAPPSSSSTVVPPPAGSVPRSSTATPAPADDREHVMVDHNNTLDQANRDRFKKLLADVQQLKDGRLPPPPRSSDTLVAPTPTPAPSALADPSSASPSAVVSPSLSPSPPPSFTDQLKSGLSRLLRVPSAMMMTHRSPSPSSPQLVNTSVSDTAAASAVVNPLLQRRELERYREKQAQFEKQRLDFISGMQVYSSDEARVVASAKAFFMATMEHAHGIGEHVYDAMQHQSDSLKSSTMPGASGHHNHSMSQPAAHSLSLAHGRKLKETAALISSFRVLAEKHIHTDAAVLAYLDDTSSAAESMVRAKEGVKFLLMAENAFTPAQVTRHMLAVEQIARATSEAERSRIEKEEEDQLKKAKEEAEAREKQEKSRADRKKKEQKLQEREERMLDELAMKEEDPITATQGRAEEKDDAGQSSEGGDVVDRKERDYKKRPAALSSAALPSSLPSPCSSPQPTPTGPSAPLPPSPPPYSPPPSPSSFEPNAMTTWGVRCLRWVGKPRDTLHHLYHLLKQLQTQIHSKCEFADQEKQRSQQKREEEKKAQPAEDSKSSSSSASPSSSLAGAPAPPSRPRRLSIGSGSSSNKGGGDVFEYVFEAGDEEIVGYHHKIKKQPPRRFAADHLLCHGETLFLLKTRWDRLIAAFYDPVSRSFDPTKIPDVYDSLKYDVLHNSDFISDVRPLYSAIKRVADCVVPQEYGVLRKDRWSIGVNIAKPLLREIIHNLERGLQAVVEHRVTLYFSSESHIHALRNVLLLCGIAANRTVATTLDAIELNYLSHAVFRLYEDLSQSPQHPLRFYVSVQFSPGAALDPFIFTEAGHTLPVSRPVPVHGRIPFSVFKQLFANLTTELPAVKPYCSES